MATAQGQEEHPHSWTDREDLEERLHHAPSTIIRRARGIWSDFKSFIGRDNILEVAVGLMIANSFTGIVNSLVTDVLLPFVSLLPFMGKNVNEKFTVLRRGPNYPYTTLERAADDGAITLAWGHFIDRVVNFFFLGVILFIVAQVYQLVSKDNIIKHTVHCAYCRKTISEKSKRCAFCCSWLDGREEKETSALAPSQLGGLPATQ